MRYRAQMNVTILQLTPLELSIVHRKLTFIRLLLQSLLQCLRFLSEMPELEAQIEKRGNIGPAKKTGG